MAVTGGGSVGECGIGRTIIYLLTYLQVVKVAKLGDSRRSRFHARADAIDSKKYIYTSQVL